MTFIKAIWDFFNGKKVIISSVLLSIAVLLEEVVINIWGVDSEIIINTHRTLLWLGLALAGTGLTHKYLKRKNGQH